MANERAALPPLDVPELRQLIAECVRDVVRAELRTLAANQEKPAPTAEQDGADRSSEPSPGAYLARMRQKAQAAQRRRQNLAKGPGQARAGRTWQREQNR